ncbi:hypothetical protein GGH92_009456, partial [Coemansia sp. RSA 2673]
TACSRAHPSALAPFNSQHQPRTTYNGWRQSIRRQGWRHLVGGSQVALVQGRDPVPRGPHPPPSAPRQLRPAHCCRRPRVPGRRARVPDCRDSRARRQRRPRQQEDPHHPPPSAARRAQRRGAQQAPWPRHHRPGRCPAQHPRHAASPEVQEGQPL